MNAPVWRLGRAAFSALLSILLLAGSAHAEEELPFDLQVKKVEFEKKLRAGLTQVVSNYRTSLDDLITRKYTVDAANGVTAVKKEREQISKDIAEIAKTDPLEFIVARIGRLNRGEVELEAHLAESTWKLTDGREMKLLRDGSVSFDGKRERDFGWVVAEPEVFFWGGKFWRTEVRDKGRRLDARNWKYPRQSLQGVFVDSVDYTGSPVPLMARAHGKMKLQLATGLKVLIRNYAVPLDQARKAQLAAGKLDDALVAKHAWEQLYEAGDVLFGTELKLGDPTESIAPKFETRETLRAGLIGTTWRMDDGNAVVFRDRGLAVLRPNDPFPFRTGWQVIDHRTVLFGHNYYQLRFDPQVTTLAGKARHRNLEKSGTLQK